MNTPTIDHIITFFGRKNLDRHLEIYKNSGFDVTEEKVRHPHGKQNRFIKFGLEYVEFFWVEDKKEFLSKAEDFEVYFYKNNRMFSIGFVAQKLAGFHKYLKTVYPKIPDTFSRGSSDKPEEKSWEFLLQPIKYLPGFYSFCLSYLKRDYTKPRKLKIADNGVYAISGITHVAKNLNNFIKKYQIFFKIKTIRKVDKSESTFKHGPHLVECMVVKRFEEKYKEEIKFLPEFQGFQSLQLIHLYCESIERFIIKINKKDFIIKNLENKVLFYSKKKDGFKFLVEEKPILEYLQERKKFTDFEVIK